MQNLSIEAATSESAWGLFGALVRFCPRWSKDDDGRYFVSVQLGSDKHALAVLDAIRTHLASCGQDVVVSSMTVALDGGNYTVRDR
jgi:hypothetical protein